MTLSAAVKKATALGADHALFELPAVESALADVLQIEPQRKAARLLVAVVGQQLREQAGYRPPVVQAPLVQPCVPLATRAVRDTEAIKILKMIVLGGQHQAALPEWCLCAGLTGQHAPEEFVPDLLDYGADVEIARDYLMLVMGDRARWMAHATGHSEWRWALHTPLRDAGSLASEERWKERFIIDDLYDNTQDVFNHHGLKQLVGNYFSPWSDGLTDAFLYFVRTKLVPRKHLYGSLSYALIEAVYQMPLHRGAHLLGMLEDGRWHRRQIEQLFEFRRNMVHTIYRSSQMG